MEHSVEAGLLGPLLLEIDNKDATPTAQKQRQLLALLLAHDSNVVTIPLLIEELWEEPPRSATTVIQTYVLSIRKQISSILGIDQATVAFRLLQTRDRGYAFNTTECVFDVRRYFELVNHAKLDLSVGRDDVAIDYFTRAEQYWRGDALADVECGLPLSAEAARLDQIRLANMELRLEAQLRERRYRDAIIDLTSLVVKHPLNERLHEYLMYALCVSGSRARAQKVFSDLRKAMIDELGIEPCAKVQRLHNYILRASDSEVESFLECDYAEKLLLRGSVDEHADGMYREFIPISSR